MQHGRPNKGYEAPNKYYTLYRFDEECIVVERYDWKERDMTEWLETGGNLVRHSC
jgi:hypothetical protein